VIREFITWHDVPDELPGDDRIVLVKPNDESEAVWLGWHDADGWYYDSGGEIEDGVKRWAEVPTGEANA
jgi:hypothetical protein